jgi:hypothetical protein
LLSARAIALQSSCWVRPKESALLALKTLLGGLERGLVGTLTSIGDALSFEFSNRIFLAVHYQPCDRPHLSKKHFLWFWTHADTPIRRYLFATSNAKVSEKFTNPIKRTLSMVFQQNLLYDATPVS